jgi:dihydroorotate dehydrogenase (fumarate)
MTELATDYLGLRLRNPLVASASPLSQTVDGIRRLADAGVGAIVLYSLFEEHLRREAAAFDALTEAGTESFAEALTYLPELADGAGSSRQYLSLIERARAAVDVPLIGSLNGVTPGGWVEHARAMQEAGVAALELNMYDVPGDPSVAGRDVEARQLEVLQRVRDMTDVPIAVKMSPYFSSIGEMAMRLDAAGAAGLVLFNRFIQPDIDPETLTVSPRVELSSPAEARLPLTWIAILRGRVRASLAASGGVDGPADVARHLLAGADVIMTTSALLRHGPGHAAVLLDGLQEWMRGRGFGSVGEARGLMSVSRERSGGRDERSGYVGVLEAAKQTYAGDW